VEMSSYLDSKGTAPRRFVLEGLELEPGTARLTPEARKIGDDLAGLLQRHPDAKVQIIGPTGAAAASLAEYLVDHGVGRERIKAESRAANRRVEIVVQP